MRESSWYQPRTKQITGVMCIWKCWWQTQELLGWETQTPGSVHHWAVPVQWRWADNGCFQQTGAHCPETLSPHLGTVEPFHPPGSIYHDIELDWKINDKIIFRDLSTLQGLGFRQFRLELRSSQTLSPLDYQGEKVINPESCAELRIDYCNAQYKEGATPHTTQLPH